jgi:hypothetical protein
MSNAPQAPRKVSDAEYERMTPAQRWDYARSFDQNQFRPADEPRTPGK